MTTEGSEEAKWCDMPPLLYCVHQWAISARLAEVYTGRTTSDLGLDHIDHRFTYKVISIGRPGPPVLRRSHCYYVYKLSTRICALYEFGWRQ